VDGFSWRRLVALLRKEWLPIEPRPADIALHHRRAINAALPFGYAINTNPQNLPTGLLSAEYSNIRRTLSLPAQHGYYDVRTMASEAEGRNGAGARRGAVRHRDAAEFHRSVDRGTSSIWSTPMPPTRRPSAMPPPHFRPIDRASIAICRRACVAAGAAPRSNSSSMPATIPNN